MIQIRCSALGKIMTSPRTKSETLSETCKSYIEELFLENEFNLKKEFSNKYTEKGIQMEDEAIQFVGNILGWDLDVVKNDKYFSNDWIKGTPDINTKTLLADIKCSWAFNTFPMFNEEDEIPNKDYFYQLQGYMMLTGHTKSELVYCLMNTPLDIVEKEVLNAHYKLNLKEEDLEVRDYIQKQHNFDHMPNKARVKRFIIEADTDVQDKIKEKVEQCNEYYEKLKTMIYE
jgi:hypothetical protein